MVDNPSFRTAEGVTIDLKAPIAEVQKVLAQALKPDRKLLSAVKFQGGGIEEIFDANEVVASAVEAPAEPSSVEASSGPVKEAEPKPKKSGPKKKAEAAATVAQPARGCPAPRFDEADIRASRVLEAFLDPDQYDDYMRHGKFVAVGADTGHRYLVANRERPDVMGASEFRSLFDLDERLPLCVHDWEVPPAEEMLAILFCVTLPGHEKLIREMPEVWES